MTLIDYELIADYFKNTNQQTEESQNSFIELSFRLMEQTFNDRYGHTDFNYQFFTKENIFIEKNSAEEFDALLGKLLDTVNNDFFYQQLFAVNRQISESDLAQIIAKMPVFCTEELLVYCTKYTNTNINTNKVLLAFINSVPRDITVSYEEKVKAIIKCNNDAYKKLQNKLEQTIQEVQLLQDKLSGGINPAKALNELKTVIADFEDYIASLIVRQEPYAAQFVKLEMDFRNTLKKLYGICPLVSLDDWKNQTPVKFDKNKHSLIGEMPAQQGEFFVNIFSLGFLLKQEDGNEISVPAKVRFINQVHNGHKKKENGKTEKARKTEAKETK